MVEKIEWNPFLKGKILVSNSARQEYEHAISEREYYYELMKKEGISGKDEFKAQIETLGRLEAQIPNIEERIQSQQQGLGLLESIINGIEQASREMQREQRRQQTEPKKEETTQGIRKIIIFILITKFLVALSAAFLAFWLIIF